MILAWLLLLTGLTLSAVAIYYSVVGLTAIFSAAVIPIMVMGGSLEIAKLVCASWLKANWERAPRFMKYYMITAVTVLMIITSMGIFGFLSKAHNDQNLVSGDVQSKIAVYDEKIKVAKENIDANRKALKQMDEAVDQVMGRSQDEKGADKAVALRRGQTKERTRLLSEITAEQKAITQLSEERAPIAAEVRKVEAEVGPIKYIAKLIYGDSIDENILEKAVTWIIILIVTVFDPLAVIMLLAAQMTFGWRPKDNEPVEVKEEPAPAPSEGFVAQEVADVIPEAVVMEDNEPLHCYKCGTELYNAPGIGPYCPNKECDVLDNTSGADPIEFTYIPPNKGLEDKLWEESVANVPTQNYPKVTWPFVQQEPEPKKTRKTRKPKNTTGQVEVQQTQSTEATASVTPVRDIEKEQQQAGILEAIIQSTSPKQTTILAAGLDERPGDYVKLPIDNADPEPTGTVGAPLPGDEYYNRNDEPVVSLTPRRRKEAGGWFPEKKK